MRMIIAMMAFAAMVASAGTLASEAPQLEGLDKIKTMRDAIGIYGGQACLL